MSTECNQFAFGFHPLKRLEIRAEFDGGAITSDGVVCSFERSRSASGSSASLPLASLIIGIPI